ncbi:unnamed protein product, partial [Scytosiphon promiscuus]
MARPPRKCEHCPQRKEAAQWSSCLAFKPSACVSAPDLSMVGKLNAEERTKELRRPSGACAKCTHSRVPLRRCPQQILLEYDMRDRFAVVVGCVAAAVGFSTMFLTIWTRLTTR